MRLPEAFGIKLAQSEVDFVIPDLSTDLPLCIDPFLLYKSRDPAMREMHGRLVSLFNQGVAAFREGRRAELDRLIDFPEVNEIGFGYSADKIQGSGLGLHLNRLLAETLAASEPLQERGLRHIEELQLVSLGVGPDRVSDIAANALKSYLIDYTRRQAELWGIPITAGVPVAHYFDFEDWEWSDGYFDLPRNPVSGLPILLVPRRIVRMLPWINYDDYESSDIKMFLNPPARSRTPRYPGMPKTPRISADKWEVVNLTRSTLSLLDHYISRKEREGAKVEPVLGPDQAADAADRQLGEEFVARLKALPTGQAAAGDYQRLVFEILNYLFEPELTDGEMEVATFLQTERRDIIYLNEAERSFWQYVRATYGSPLVMFEIKNVAQLELEHVNQTATYLGARIGMLGFIVTRKSAGENIVRKTYAIYNDTPSLPRRMVLIVTDSDLDSMIRLRQDGKSPVKYIQGLYQSFRKRVQ